MTPIDLAPASGPGFDFDAWLQLARTDPEAFEAQRRRVIEARIARAPAGRQQRLRGIQFRIDMERARARSPMGACIRISAMMWDALLGEDGLCCRIATLQAMVGDPSGAGRHRSKPHCCADIIPFPGRRG